MVKLRLLRVGRHKEPVYRVVAVDSKAKANGAYIELLGQYDPLNNKFNLKKETIQKWLNNGAQPTQTVKSLLQKEKIWSEFMLEKQKNKTEQKKTRPQQETKQKSANKILETLNVSSKFKSKYSEEDIQKRESQEFKVVEETEYQEDEERTIIISLNIEHVQKILNEDRNILFMKKLPAFHVKRVLIYATLPVGLVIGEFDLKSSQSLSRTKAWNEYGKNSTFTKKMFDKYFDGAEIDGVKMMEIDGFVQYKTPKAISKYGMNRGPSGFAYLK